VGAPQRLSIDGRKQVAGADAGGGGKTRGVDVAHQQAGERREPDGASPLERNRCAVDDEPEPRHETADRIGVLERVRRPERTSALVVGLVGTVSNVGS
jgi:hypothetical protein